MTTLTPEEMVLGACLLTPDGIRFATGIIEPGDFSNPRHETVFHAMVQLRKADEPIEPFSVYTRAVALGAKGLNPADPHMWMENVGSGASIGFYADQVKEASARRNLHAIATRLLRESQDTAAHPSQAAQAAAEAIKDIQTGNAGRLTTKTLRQILEAPDDNDWIIPNLLEKGDRVVITGFEGGGKTTWVRQMAICMAAGIHPTTLNHLEKPLTVLVVDAENSEKQWKRQTRGMHRVAAQYGLRDPQDSIHIKAGERLDITKDATLGEIHRLIDDHEPDILAIGPFYKLVSTGVNNDQEAAPLIMALDSLRERGVALMMEAHAKKGDSSQAQRDLAPRGSAALMGWPEFGFGLHPTSEESSTVVRWRGDREQGRDWPKEVWRGGVLPWTGDTVAPTIRQNFNRQAA